MSMLSSQLTIANDNISIWQQRRNELGTVWNDSQWAKFERVCNEEIKTQLTRNVKNAEALDHALTAALQLLNRY